MIFPVSSAATEIGRWYWRVVVRFRSGLRWRNSDGFGEFICDDTLFLFDYGFVEDMGIRMTPLGHARAIWEGASGKLEQATGRHLETICAYSFVKEFTHRHEAVSRPVKAET